MVVRQFLESTIRISKARQSTTKSKQVTPARVCSLQMKIQPKIWPPGKPRLARIQVTSVHDENLLDHVSVGRDFSRIRETI